MEISGKTVLLTGASSGLGAAMAVALVMKGATVFGLARDLVALNQLGNRLGSRFQPVKMDISDKEAVFRWIDTTFSESYSPDILINNAGVGSFHKIEETSVEDWAAMVNTNLNGVYYITSKIVPLMKAKSGSKHIINIGSILGTTGRVEGSAYSATKYAINGFSDSLFKELRVDDIKVTCINSGSIETDFFRKSGILASPGMLQPKDVAATVVHVLETPDNMLINELMVRPLNPQRT